MMEHHHDVASYRCVLGCQLRSHLTATTHVNESGGGQAMATVYVAEIQQQETVDSVAYVISCRRVWVPSPGNLPETEGASRET